jgi:hypothetical protein
VGKAAKVEKTERTAKVEKTERAAKVEKTERAAKVAKTERTAKVEKVGRAAKAAKTISARRHGSRRPVGGEADRVAGDSADRASVTDVAYTLPMSPTPGRR